MIDRKWFIFFYLDEAPAVGPLRAICGCMHLLIQNNESLKIESFYWNL